MSKIGWCDKTINPLVGCAKISDGCQHCYAEKMARRLKAMGIPKYKDVVDENGWTGQIGADFSVFNKLPKKPCKIFYISMGDLFYDKISNGRRAMVFYMMRDYPQHTHMLLTKRPDRMEYFFKHKISPNCIKSIPNLWLGVTVEHEKYLHRVETLLQIPAAVRFLSIEPMLGPVDLYGYLGSSLCIGPKGFDDEPIFRQKVKWVIIGCESGPGRRKTKLEWIESAVQQCVDAGVPVFVKQAEINGRLVKMPEIMGRTWAQVPGKVSLNAKI